jgi:hypothetical protein
MQHGFRHGFHLLLEPMNMAPLRNVALTKRKL